LFSTQPNDKSGFTVCYENLTINMLLENPEILEKTLKSFRSKHTRKSRAKIDLKGNIDKILNMLTDYKENKGKDKDKIKHF
jgi:hypothetical protein